MSCWMKPLEYRDPFPHLCHLKTRLGNAIVYETDEDAYKLIPARLDGIMDGGYNILVLAIRNRKQRCTEALIERSSVLMRNVEDGLGYTPLMEAANSGDLVAMNLLVFEGVNSSQTSKRGYTALSCAIHYRPFEIATMSEPQKSEAEKQMVDTIVKMVRFLVRHGANIHAVTSENKTVLQHYINSCTESFISPEVIACLIEVGADEKQAVRTEWHTTPELAQKIDDSVERGLARREAKPSLADNLQPKIVRYPLNGEHTLYSSELVDLVCSYV